VHHYDVAIYFTGQFASKPTGGQADWSIRGL